MNLIRQELKRLRTEPRDLRRFGLSVGGVFLILGLWFLFGQKPWHAWFWIAGTSLIFLAIALPQRLKLAYIGWMALAFVLGFFASTVILTLFYYSVVTPIGWAAKLCGKDFLNRKWSDAPSYWLLRAAPRGRESSHYEQQF